MFGHDHASELNSEELELLWWLQGAPSGEPLVETDLCDDLCVGENELFYLAAGALAKGHPICLYSLTGWRDSAVADEDNYFAYWLSTDVADLESMARRVGSEIGFLRSLLSGIDIAKRRMVTTAPAASMENRSHETKDSTVTQQECNDPGYPREWFIPTDRDLETLARDYAGQVVLAEEGGLSGVTSLWDSYHYPRARLEEIERIIGRDRCYDLYLDEKKKRYDFLDPGEQKAFVMSLRERLHKRLRQALALPDRDCAIRQVKDELDWVGHQLVLSNGSVLSESDEESLRINEGAFQDG